MLASSVGELRKCTHDKTVLITDRHCPRGGQGLSGKGGDAGRGRGGQLCGQGGGRSSSRCHCTTLSSSSSDPTNCAMEGENRLGGAEGGGVSARSKMVSFPNKQRITQFHIILMIFILFYFYFLSDNDFLQNCTHTRTHGHTRTDTHMDTRTDTHTHARTHTRTIPINCAFYKVCHEF